MPGKYPVDYFGEFKKGVDFSQALKDKKIERSEIARKGLFEERGMKVREGDLKLRQDAVPTAERTMSQEQLNESLKQIPKVHTPISSGEYAVMDSTIRYFEKTNNLKIQTELQPFRNAAEAMSKNNYSRYDTYRAMKGEKGAWQNGLKKRPLDAIQKAIDRAMDAGNKEDIEKFAKMYEQFDSGEILNSIFAASYQYDQDLKRKGAIDEQKNLPKNAEAAIIRELNKPKPDSERLETLRQMMTQGKAKEERLYPTTEGYQPREDAIGKMKPKGEKSTQPRSMKTWTLPDGSNITIANNQEPPKGAVPFKDPRMLKKDLAAAEEKIIANMNDSRSEPHIKLFNENSDASHFYLFDPGKKEGVIRKFFGSSDDKTTKIQLPIVKGRQTTLKDLRETAKKHNKTLEQVLKEYAEKQKKGKK